MSYNYQRYLQPEPTPMDIPSTENCNDDFFMYVYKIKKCHRSRSHDWTQCPFLHRGEKARRRDPEKYHYAAYVCPFNRGGGICTKGDQCEHSHGVFEYWLHPARYRTCRCNAGQDCRRKVCFFAHSEEQVRSTPDNKCICQFRMHTTFCKQSEPASALTFKRNPVPCTYIKAPMGIVEVPLSYFDGAHIAMELPPEYTMQLPPMGMPVPQDFPLATAPIMPREFLPVATPIIPQVFPPVAMPIMPKEFPPPAMPMPQDFPPASMPILQDFPPPAMPMPQDFPALAMPMTYNFPPLAMPTAPSLISFPSTLASAAPTSTTAGNKVQLNWESVLATMGLLKNKDVQQEQEAYNGKRNELAYDDLDLEMEFPNVDWVSEFA